ncbi:MAG: nucleoside triphosphate pyrophosphohydrolase [Anaerolineae bacterium]|nr:nucleoside triphosphate pyrophosphohydrolase [Anaerolineae bacterium]
MGITIVGLGPGDPGLLTRRAWEVLSSAPRIYLRTRQHPVVEALPGGATLYSFDDLYEQHDAFDQVYDSIVAALMDAVAQAGEVLYAVPGDPMVAEATVTRLMAACKTRNIPVVIVSGVSFIEPALALVGVDASDGLQVVDALDLATLHHPPLNPDKPALIAQVYSRMVASDLKLTLMNQYPDEHPVMMIQAAGMPSQSAAGIPLHEIDRIEPGLLATVYVPPYDASPGAVASLEGFQETIAHLRAPEGCPWDQEQTHFSLRPHLIEEAYEVLDAIDSEIPEKLMEELGDLLLQIVLHSQIAVEDGEFRMADVIRTVDAKMKRRHPHVWGDVNVNGDPEQVKANWEQIKAQERRSIGASEKSLLDGLPASLPALAQAHAYDERARQVGWDWPDESGVIAKLHEEIQEILDAITPAEKFDEIGDLLLVASVWARWHGVNPEDALRAANRKFYRRFTHIERSARQKGVDLRSMSLDDMEVLWQEAKMLERQSGKQ